GCGWEPVLLSRRPTGAIAVAASARWVSQSANAPEYTMRPVPDTSADFERYRESGDRGIRDRLVAAHAGLAYSIARRFEGRGEESDDLKQVALLALLHAVDRYDPALGNSFTTFATPTIAGALKRHLRDHTWIVRPSRSVSECLLHSTTTRDRL